MRNDFTNIMGKYPRSQIKLGKNTNYFCNKVSKVQNKLIYRLLETLKRERISVPIFSIETGIPKDRVYKWKQQDTNPKSEDEKVILAWLDKMDIVPHEIKEDAVPELLEFLLFLYHTGTRPNEARQLTYEHINHDSRLLMVPASISKNKKDDYVPLSQYILDKYKGEGLIFGTPVNYYSKKFNGLKSKLGLPAGVNLYSIKHTRAVHLAQDGASPYAIMQLFRHSSLDITMRYLAGLGLTVNREAADKVR